MLAGARYVMTVVTCTVEVTSVWAASAPAGGGEAAPAGPAARGGGGVDRVLSPQVVNPVLFSSTPPTSHAAHVDM